MIGRDGTTAGVKISERGNGVHVTEVGR
jgi:hypothetical protein